jgi:V/A-type H+-transporting ATPase subunit F
MYKAAVVGDWDSIYGFGALGLETFRVEGNDPEAARRILRSLSEQDYAVVYITEALAAVVPDELERCSTMLKPALILIPGVSGNTGEGMKAVRRSVEQAVGSDILFGGH